MDQHVDTSGKALIDFWGYAAEKGLTNRNTANARKAACKEVLSVLDNWETLDIKALDLNDIGRRFENKRSHYFTPQSLGTYKKRFESGVTEFLRYKESPSSWKGPAKERATKRERTAQKASNDHLHPVTLGASGERAVPVRGLVEFPFPIREGQMAYLRLPSDLKLAEVKRITAFLNTLAVDNAAGA